jgi:hypothetical protein
MRKVKKFRVFDKVLISIRIINKFSLSCLIERLVVRLRW